MMIKLKDILLNEVRLPSVLYHSITSEADLNSILRSGISADSNSFVYLSEKPITRAPYKFSVKVKVPDLDQLYDWRDMWSDSTDKQYDPSNPYYVYEGDIPKQYISSV